MYAHFDHTATQPSPVLGWIDGDTPYSSTLPTADLLPLSQAQWDNRLSTPYVSAGALVAAPAPTAAQLLADAQASQSMLVKNACADQIVSGFSSSALGAPYAYPGTTIDQGNLAANVLSSIYPNLPAGWTTPQQCKDANGVWAYLSHTAAQIQQVGEDGKTAILNCLLKNNTLQGEIAAATTVSAVQAIVW